VKALNKSNTLSFIAILVIAVISISGFASCAAPAVSTGTAVVDGNIGDWDLNADFFDDMYRAGIDDANHPLQSKCYLQFDGVGTLYVLVLTTTKDSSYFECIQDNEAWVKIYLPDDTQHAYLKLDRTDTADFEWVTIDGICRGFEGRIAITPGDYYIQVHINVYDPIDEPNESQTSKFLSLQHMTLNVVPEASMIAISASMIGAFGLFIVRKSKKQ